MYTIKAKKTWGNVRSCQIFFQFLQKQNLISDEKKVSVNQACLFYGFFISVYASRRWVKKEKKKKKRKKERKTEKRKKESKKERKKNVRKNRKKKEKRKKEWKKEKNREKERKKELKKERKNERKKDRKNSKNKINYSKLVEVKLFCVKKDSGQKC